MRTRVVGGIVTLLIALLMAMAPLAVMAQPASLDPEQRAIVAALAKEVGSIVLSGVVAPMAVVPDDEEPDDEETEDQETVEEFPDTTDDPEAPAPEIGTPEPEPEGEPVVLPDLDLTDLAEYSAEGVTIQVPAAWIVDPSPEEDTNFLIEIPDTEVFIGVGTEETFLFPSLLSVALFRSQADILMADYASDAQVEETATYYTPQGLPMAKMTFSGEDNGEPVTGDFYVVAPNEETYLVVGAGPQEEMEYAAPGLELIAESITFDEEMIAVEEVGDEALAYQDSNGGQEVTIPAGWFFFDTGDSNFPVLMMEPEARYVVAAGTGAALGEDFTLLLEDFIPAEGELDPAEYDALVEAFLDVLSATGSEILMAEDDQSEVIPLDDGVRVRIEGEADFGEDLIMPVGVYADLRSEDGSVAVVFGDVETAFAEDAEILGILESVTALAE